MDGLSAFPTYKVFVLVLYQHQHPMCVSPRHHSNRSPWLRALVLGANDGLVSTAALLMGVGAGTTDLQTLRLAGVAGLIAGALSMAVGEQGSPSGIQLPMMPTHTSHDKPPTHLNTTGEYVSVSSQRDAERADILKEEAEQLRGPAAQQRELDELAHIYEARGLPPALALQVCV
jgi:VIT1/CCC1 family predicted Fe2+/Mn2+ transporter